MAVTHDLPVDFFDQANLLDANFGFGLIDTNIPTSKFFVEKYAAKKGDYTFLPIGTPSENHPQAVLYEESNFRDIGGGLMTFERKYAQIPEDHEELVTATIRAGRILGLEGSSFRANFIGGDLIDGNQLLLVNGVRDTVTVQKSTTYEIPAIRKTSYFLKTNDPLTSPDVFMDNSSEIINVLDESQTAPPVVVVLYSWPNGATATRTRYFNGAKFPRDTVFRKTNGGRYLGEIYIIQEFRLLNDVVTNYGSILSDTLISTPET